VAGLLCVNAATAATMATAAAMTSFLCSGVTAQPTEPASENRPIQVERSFANSNIQAIILHLVRDGVAGGHW